MELDNGQPVRSRRREHGCGRRWWSGVTTSYGPNTGRMGSNGPKNRTWWGEEREELKVLVSSAHDCNKEELSKSFDRPLVYFLAQFRGLGGYEHGQAMYDFSTLTFREPWLLKKTSTSTAYRIGKVLIVKRLSRLVARNQVDGDYQMTCTKKGSLVKGFCNLVVRKSI
jgi:hypothetical protein